MIKLRKTLVLSSNFITELKDAAEKGAERPDGKFFDFDL